MVLACVQVRTRARHLSHVRILPALLPTCTLAIFLLPFFALTAHAVPDGEGNEIFVGNVGIGTTAPVGGLTVMSGNVGIGTWSPTALFQVWGGNVNVRSRVSNSPAELRLADFNDRQLILRSSSNNGNNSFQITTTSTGADLVIQHAGNPNAIHIDSSAANGVGFGTTTPVGGLAIMSGNVGIGTWSPTGLLQVAGGDVKIGLGTFDNPSANFDLYVTGNIQADGSIFLADGTELNDSGDLGTVSGWTDDGNVIRLDTQSDLVGIGTTLNTAGTKLAVMAGNVGIGTWKPNSPLDIFRLGTGLRVGTGFDMGYQYFTAVNYNGLTTTFDVASSQDMVIGINSTVSGGGPGQGLHLRTRGTNRMYITGPGNIGIGTTTPVAGLAVMSGNVGIGTWSPTSKVEINDFNKTTSSLYSTGGNLAVYTKNSAGTDVGAALGLGGYYNGSSRAAFAHIRGAKEVANGISSNGYMALYTNRSAVGTVEAMRISSQGNVGIGTSNPIGGLVVMNGNVGIGTWSPTGSLQIVGGDLKVGLGTFDNPSANFDIYTTGNLEVDGSIFLADGTEINEAADLGGTAGWTDDGGVVRLDTQSDLVGIGTTLNSAGTKLAVMAGNVGIGTWNPVEALHINGDINLGTDANATYGLGFSERADIGLFHKGLTDFLYMSSVGSVRMNIDSNNNGSSSAFIVASDGNEDTGGTELLRVTESGNVGIGTTTPVGGLTVMSGNVGIGTWNPTYALTVVGSGYFSSTATSVTALSGYQNNGSAPGVYGYSLNQYGVSGYGDGAGGAGIYGAAARGMGGYFTQASDIFGDTANSTVYIHRNVTLNGNDMTGPVLLVDDDTAASGHLAQFIRGSSTKFQVGSDGNVGIGTSAPVGGLIVMSGNVGVGTWSPTEALEVVGTVSATAFAGDGSGLTGLPAGGAWTDGGTNIFIADDFTNNVGIGTTTPDAALEIVEDGGGAPFMISDTYAGNGDMFIVNADGKVGIGTTLMSSSAGLSVMNGNVGIGTWNPLSRLDVAGDIILTRGGNDIRAGIAAAPDRSVITIYDSSTGNMHLDAYNGLRFTSSLTATASDPVFQFRKGSVTKMIMDTNSNVGIGTTTPVGGLVVMNGNVGIGTWSPRQAFEVNNTIILTSEYDNGNSGAAVTIDFANGNKQVLTLDDNPTITFTAPNGTTNLLLRLIQDGTGSRTVTWPAAVKWPGGSAPTLTTTAAAEDIVSCFYNGTNYYCTASMDFQ